MSWQLGDVPVATDSVVTFVPTDGSDPVLFDAATARLHRLAGSSATVWAAIDGSRTMADVIDLVSALHRIEAVATAADIEATLERLRTLGVLRVARSPRRR